MKESDYYENETEFTPLEEDAMRLLRRLCYDRGVVLHVTCVEDSRIAIKDLCNKHNIPLKRER